MYLLIIGWMYVVLMMSVAEAMSPSGTVLGAIFTFVLYGVGPVSLVVYLLGTPARKRRLKAEQESEAQPASGAPDASGEASAGAVPPVRKEP